MCVCPQTYVYYDPDGIRRTVVGPCGKCVECLKDYQNSWKIRLSDEFAVTCKGVFVTLTYSPLSAHLADPSLVEDEYSIHMLSKDRRPLTLCMDDPHAWLKRCRERWFRACGKRPKFKYFLCGEYGPTTLRPHYHALFLGIDYEDFVQYFQQDWEKRFGFVDSSKVVISQDKSPQRVANYVSKYCAKGEFENPRVKEYPDLFESPRRCMSKGIGRSAALALKHQYEQKFGLSLMRMRYAPVDEFDFKPRPWYRDKSIQYDKTTTCFLAKPKAKIVDVPVIPPYQRRDPNTGRFRTYTPFTRILVQPKPQRVRFFIPREKVLERLTSSLVCTFEDPQSGKSFTYKMPRYYKSYILGEKSPLAQICSKYLQARARANYSEKLAQLQASHRDWSDVQTVHTLEVQMASERRRRSQNARKALNTFYSQSKV